MSPASDPDKQLRAVDPHPSIVETTAVWRSEDDTRAFAAALAAQPAIANAFVELRGDLGAGKTTLVRHLLRALGVAGRIKSPTYAVVEPHEATLPGGAPLAVWHFDFYRFGDPREWEDAGFRDLFASAGLKLAEWPENAARLLPVPDLVVSIDTLPAESDTTDDDGAAPPAPRRVTVSAHTPAGRTLLAALPA